MKKLLQKIDFKERFQNWRTLGGLYIGIGGVLLFTDETLLKTVLVIGAVGYGIYLFVDKK